MQETAQSEFFAQVRAGSAEHEPLVLPTGTLHVPFDAGPLGPAQSWLVLQGFPVCWQVPDELSHELSQSVASRQYRPVPAGVPGKLLQLATVIGILELFVKSFKVTTEP